MCTTIPLCHRAGTPPCRYATKGSTHSGSPSPSTAPREGEFIVFLCHGIPVPRVGILREEAGFYNPVPCCATNHVRQCVVA